MSNSASKGTALFNGASRGIGAFRRSGELKKKNLLLSPRHPAVQGWRRSETVKRRNKHRLAIEQGSLTKRPSARRRGRSRDGEEEDYFASGESDQNDREPSFNLRPMWSSADNRKRCAASHDHPYGWCPDLRRHSYRPGTHESLEYPRLLASETVYNPQTFARARTTSTTVSRRSLRTRLCRTFASSCLG